jgi:ankyrin repeat protein
LKIQKRILIGVYSLLLEMTPLHFASFFGHSEVFKFLCNHGDDPGAKTDLGLTALHLACHNGHLEVIKQYDHFTKKEERAKEDSFGKYPIHYAADKGFPEVILISFSQQNLLILQ